DFNLVQFEIIIHPDWHRQGYGLETLRGLLAFAFDGLRARRVVASCDARNRAAKELLLKAGFRPESKCIDDRFVRGHWVSTLGCAMLRLEYEKADLQIVGDEVRSV
ncbi:MAG TPA: GNAT family protein, partial [Verrucomicrobiae bacterium]|nr:GNAT family protein [Verrucomicrobiae bacterium]